MTDIDIYEKINPRELYILGIRNGILEVIENHDGVAVIRGVEIPWNNPKKEQNIV